MKSPRLRRVISLVLAAVCLGSGAMFVRRLLDYRTGDAAYAEAAQIATLPEPEPETTAEPAPEPSAEATPSAPQTPVESAPAAIDLPALQAVNADVIGWISIPDTAISYPLVQGSDNDYYLTHTWNRVSSAVGAIFLDARCPSDLGGFNAILYGHRRPSATDRSRSLRCRPRARAREGRASGRGLPARCPAGTGAGTMAGSCAWRWPA